MIKAGEELLKLQKENQELKARVYALSSQVISLEQQKIDLTETLDAVRNLVDEYFKGMSISPHTTSIE